MEKSTLPEKIAAVWEADDFDTICHECGEAPLDCQCDPVEVPLDDQMTVTVSVNLDARKTRNYE